MLFIPFVSVSHFNLTLIFADMARTIHLGWSIISLSSLAANIRLGWKQLTVTNTVAKN